MANTSFLNLISGNLWPPPNILRSLRKLSIDLYPSLSLRINRAKRERIVKEFRLCDSIIDHIVFTKKYMGSGACQIPSEIEGTLAVVASIAPRYVCEIGTADGGTSLLLSQWLPTVDLMVCIDLYVRNKDYLQLLRRPSQRMYFLNGSSYARSTINKVRQILNGKKLDVLFIDGDHRYEGVKSDFLSYRHFVSEGGFILFHDIVPDHGNHRAGEVPVLWKELKTFYPYQEFIDNPIQDGFGIGLIRYSASIVLPSEFENTVI